MILDGKIFFIKSAKKALSQIYGDFILIIISNLNKSQTTI